MEEKWYIFYVDNFKYVYTLPSRKGVFNFPLLKCGLQLAVSFQ